MVQPKFKVLETGPPSSAAPGFVPPALPAAQATNGRHRPRPDLGDIRGHRAPLLALELAHLGQAHLDPQVLGVQAEGDEEEVGRLLVHLAL